MQQQHSSLTTLEAFIEGNGPIDLDDAVDMCVRVLNVLQYCHERNMIHAHLRPDKIVMSDGQPILVDFSFPINGAFNGAINGSFLELPEYQVNIHAVERSDQISDITAVAGLLFYALTREAPGALKDRDGRMPHQRPAVRSRLQEVAGSRLFLVNQIFDKAFQWQMKERYANAQELANDLNNVKSYSKAYLAESNLEDLLKAMRSSTQSQTVTPHEMRLQTAFNGLQIVFAELATSLESDFREMEAGYRKEVLRPVYTAFVRFNYKLLSEARLTMQFRLEIVGSEIVVSALVSRGASDGVMEELFRTEHHSFYDSSQLEKTVRYYVAQNLASLIASV